MENTPDELLKYAIQNSKNTFLENGYKDEESLESFLGQSLYYLYQNSTSTGFSREAGSALAGIEKEDVLKFLVSNYMGKINDTEDANIREDFQHILKNKSKTNGLENAEEALKTYIETGDASGFPEESREEILKYKPDSLLKSMGIVTAKRVLQGEPVNLEASFKPQGVKGFLASDFAVLSNGEYDIDKIVGLMECIRSGRIIPTKDENILQKEDEERE